MIRILFIDDDIQILDGIRRAMYGMRGEWQMHFSQDPIAALRELESEPLDVVVSDMRLPQMQGAEFLAEVKRLHPQTIRILLSGQAESESIIRATRSAHRYLSKPCDAETLKAAILRTFDLRAVLQDTQLLQMVGSVDALPTPPKAYQELVDCIRDPHSAIADVSRIIRQDVAMTAKVLKLANSGFFGIREPVQSIDRAVAFVGMEAMAALVLGQELFNSRHPVSLPDFSLEVLGRHSFECAAWAREIAIYQQFSTRVADAAFLCGVLHDVGRLVFATRPPPAEAAAREGWRTEITTNMKTHHARVGGYLLGLWGFPEAVVEAIVWHHTPSRCAEPKFGLCGLLHVADYLAHATAAGAASSTAELEPGYLEARGLADRVDDWMKTRVRK